MKKILLLVSLFTFSFLFSFAQAPNWIWAESAGGNYMNSFDVVTDSIGNSYITGYYRGGSVTIGNFTLTNTGYFDMFVAKYDPNGNVLWAKSAGGNNNDAGNGIAVDKTGNVYVVGDFQSSDITFGSTTLINTGSNISFYIVKYDPYGNVLWVQSPTGGASNSGATHVAVDTRGNIYMSGCFSTSTFILGSITLISTAGGGNNFYVAKLDPDGNFIWAETANAAGNGNGQDNAIATDAKGNVYVTGYNYGVTQTFGTFTLNQIGTADAFTVKYDSSGNVKWAQNFGGPANGSGTDVTSQGLVIDTSGNVYITGYFNCSTVTFGSIILPDNGGGSAYFIAKYDTGGTPLWAQSESGGSGGGQSWEDGMGIAVDNNNNVYTVSYYTSDSLTIGAYTLYSNNFNNYSNADGFLAKYDGNGNVLWVYGFEKQRDGGPNAITINNRNIYVTGSFTSDSLTFGRTNLTNPNPGTPTAFLTKLSTCGLTVSISTVNSTCGNPTGSATAIVSNGTPPYTYFWTDASKKATADSLASGLYIATVTDKNGCTASATANIADATAPAISITSLANVTCPGGNNGSIIISVSGGTSPYTYYWDNGSTTQNISKLTAGPYQIEVTDANGCKSTQVITISQPPLFALYVSTTTSSCGDSTGSATLTVSGGTGLYSYLWTPSGQTTYSASSLAAGSYSVMVIDSSGCKDSISADVENAGGPIVTITNITAASCFTGTEGTVSLSVTGGTSPYTYSWSNGATKSNLTAPIGYYNLIVTDAASPGCKGVTSAQIQDTLPQGITLCEVTVDSNQQNEVFWNRTTEKKIASYNIYRETTANGVYRLAASQPADSLSMWIDPIAVPQVRGYKYEVSEVDSCGDESVLSPADKTMQLSISHASSCGYNLFWNNYIGYNITQYLIFRDSAGTGFRQIDSVNASKTSWTDHTCYPASDSIAYFVEAEIPTGCTPTNRPEKVNNTTTRSNTQHNIALILTGTSTLTSASNSISVYPNPAIQKLNIKFNNVKSETGRISIVDITGREIYSELSIVNGELSMNVGNLAAGIYFVKVTTNTSSQVVKFVKE
ncbi:MAG: T9SS type A sorting domain-containing protein [Bacteroidia bacterium]